MYCYRLFVAVFLLFFLSLSNAICDRQYNLEIDRGITSTRLRNCYGSTPYSVTPCTQYRSEASSGRSVRFETDGQSVSYNIISLSRRCYFRVNDIIYSNDGSSDRISVYLDNNKIGEFATVYRSNYGHLWNVFRNSGEIGTVQTLGPGEHRLTFAITSTDRYGVELDYVRISFTQCDGPCPVATSSSSSSIYESCNSDISFQTENGISSPPLDQCESMNPQTPCVQYRSGASNGLSVYMTRIDQNVTHTITSTSWCAFNITDIQYSNNGGPDRISIYLDHDFIGDFNTIRTYGGDSHLWNIFRSSYAVGTTQIMSPGEHQLTVKVTSTDLYGVEIDKVNILFSLCDGECPVLLTTRQPVGGEECYSDDNLEIESAFSASLSSCDSLISQTPCNQYRSEASNGIAVRLSSNGQNVSYVISSPSQCSLHVDNIRYSNDGHRDQLAIYLDNNMVSEFTTLANSGAGNFWNVFRSSGIIGSPLLLTLGEHRLTIAISLTDEYGVELDNLTLSFTQCDGECPSIILPMQQPVDESCNAVLSIEMENGLSLLPLQGCDRIYSFATCVQLRSQASGELSVRVVNNRQDIWFNVTSQSQCFLQVNNVMYSNDGSSDTISVYFDSNRIGTFTTREEYGEGNLWNVFESSGIVGNRQIIVPGEHRLTFRVDATDQHGVELDKVNISFTHCNGDCPIVLPMRRQMINYNEECNSVLNLELENGISSTFLKLCNDVSAQTPCIQYRSEASDELTVYLTSSGQYVSFNITSRSRCTFHVIGVQYSNDGDPDTVSIYLDNDRFGRFITHAFSQGGNLWNMFEDSGLVGNTQILVPGEHTLTIRVSSTDLYGIELDMIRIEFSMCEGECPSVTPLHRPDDQNSITNSDPQDSNTNSKNTNTYGTDETEGDGSEADKSGGLSAGAIGGILATIIVVLLVIVITIIAIICYNRL